MGRGGKGIQGDPVMRYLLTQTLISSWLYQFNCGDEQEEEARADFLRTLRKEPKETTEAMQNGIDFENEVYKIVHDVPRSPHAKWEGGIQAVATVLRGAQTQVRASRGLELAGDEYLVYGVLDAIRAGVIFDVKFSNKTFGSTELAGKYLDSPQHPAYFWIVPEAYEFRYLGSDGFDLYVETYRPEDCRPFGKIAAEFIESLRADGLYNIYTEFWKARD